MNNEGSAFLVGIIGGFVSGMLVAISLDLAHINNFKDEAIELGHAEYDSKTGVWQWKSEIKTEK